MPKVTDAHRQARRQQILGAAFTCFGREGFHATTMQDICDEADLSPGAVYNYFDGKADIIRAIADESRDSLDALFDSIDEDQLAPQVLAALVERLGAFAEQPGDAAAGGHRVRVRLWGEALSASEVHEVLAENQADFIETVAAIIREGQAEGEFDKDMNPEALARALMAFHQGMVLQKALSPDTLVQPAFEEFRALLRDTAS
jgi:AcrR family transcriptional regulator